MNLKNTIVLICFAMNMFMAQSSQAMEWAWPAAKLSAVGIPLLAVGLVQLKNHIFTIKRVEAKVDEIKQTVSALDRKVDGVDKKVADLQLSFANKSSEILSHFSDLQQQFSTLQTDVELGLTNAQEAREEMNNKLIEMQKTIGNAEKLLAEVASSSSDTNALVQQFAQQLDALKNQMSTFQANLGRLEEKIAQLPTREDIQRQIDPINDRLVAFQNIIEGQLRVQHNAVMNNINQIPMNLALSGLMVTPQGSNQPKQIGYSSNK